MADTVYTYTGNPYQVASYSYTTSDFISGSFTVATSLAPNLSDYAVAPIASDFSDGVESSASLDIHVSTDASGDIVQWILIFDTATFGGAMVESVFDPSSVYGEDSATSVAIDQAIAYNYDEPGAWAESTTDQTAAPEPASLFLVAAGLLAAAGLGRRRSGNAAVAPITP
jgi:hypothetical protein